MLEIVQAGGWLMLPIIACSIVAAAIVLERLWTLRPEHVSPKNLVRQVHEWARHDQLDPGHLQKLHDNSPLGRILATALTHRHADRDVVKEKIEDSGRHVVHELERYLTSLGTIAAVSPLLGLLGTVIGMIKVFAAITANGVGNPAVLAGGISEALITTAAGLCVAIPALIGYRYLRGRVDGLVVQMEKETVRFLDSLLERRRSELMSVSNEPSAPLKRRA